MPVTKHLVKEYKNEEAISNVVDYIRNSNFIYGWGSMGIFMSTTIGIYNEFIAVKNVMGVTDDLFCPKLTCNHCP